jgi:hypothetical protein
MLRNPLPTSYLKMGLDARLRSCKPENIQSTARIQSATYQNRSELPGKNWLCTCHARDISPAFSPVRGQIVRHIFSSLGRCSSACCTNSSLTIQIPIPAPKRTKTYISSRISIHTRILIRALPPVEVFHLPPGRCQLFASEPGRFSLSADRC